MKEYEFNIRSSKQISDFLYNFLKLSPQKKTKKGAASTDIEALTYHAEKDENKFCQLLLKNRKLEKIRGTYIPNFYHGISYYIDRYNIFGIINPEVWLNTTETFRSSASSPNLQNVPKHGNIYEDENIKIPATKLRECFIPINENFLLAEVDYSGAEVNGAANLSKDKQLIEDLNNDLDMHSHWTNVIFGWNYDLSHIKKNFQEERYLVKNTWTFANFYKAGAKSMAEAFRKFDIYKKFAKEKLGKRFDLQFEDWSINHISECQDIFYSRYSGFKAWQDQLIKDYYKNGYVESLLGFRRNYPLTTTEIVNFPIQSTSFHILLHSIIRIQKELFKQNFKSYMVLQIHDSILFMIYKSEIFELIEMVEKIMKNHELPVPKLAQLNVEWEFGKNWFNMKGI